MVSSIWPSNAGTNSREQCGKVPRWSGLRTTWVREYLGPMWSGDVLELAAEIPCSALWPYGANDSVG